MWHIVAVSFDADPHDHWQMNDPTYEPFAVGDRAIWLRKWEDELPEYPQVEQTNQESLPA